MWISNIATIITLFIFAWGITNLFIYSQKK